MSPGVAVAEAAVVGAAGARDKWRRDRFFYTGMAVVAALIVFAGFARSYYLKSFFGTPALPPVFHLHGLLFTCWIALFVTQTSLIAARRTVVHRRLGVAGGFLFVLMLIAGAAAATASVRRGFTPPGGPPPLMFFIIPVGDLVAFASLCGAALYARRRPDTHKRLMLLATISLLTAPIARIPFVGGGILTFYALTDLLIIAAFVYDRLTRGRVHPALLWGGALLVLSQPLRIALAGTTAWLAFAKWVAG
jgi:hypothetical protein